MKRFVDLQDSDVGYRFAWFDTITDKFESHSGEMAWDTFKEFVECYEGEEVGRYRAIYIGGETPRIGPDSTRDPVFRLFESREANMIKTRTWEEINRTLNKPGGVFIGIDPAIEPLLPMWGMGPVYTHMGRAYGKSYFLKKWYEEAKRDALMRHSLDMFRYYRSKGAFFGEETPLMKLTKEMSPPPPSIESMWYRNYQMQPVITTIPHHPGEWKPIKATPKPKRKKMSKKETISRLEDEILELYKVASGSRQRIVDLERKMVDCEQRIVMHNPRQTRAAHTVLLESNYLRLSEKVAVLCEALGYAFEMSPAQLSKLVAVRVPPDSKKNPKAEKPKEE